MLFPRLYHYVLRSFNRHSTDRGFVQSNSFQSVRRATVLTTQLYAPKDHYSRGETSERILFIDVLVRQAGCRGHGPERQAATSRAAISGLVPLAHAPVTPLAPAHNETLSRRPRPPAPAALLDSSQRVRPERQSLAQLVHSSPRRRSARHGPCAARPAPRSAHRCRRRTECFKDRSQTGSLGQSLPQLRRVS